MRCLRIGLMGLFLPCNQTQQILSLVSLELYRPIRTAQDSAGSHCLSNIRFSGGTLTFEAHAFEADDIRSACV